MWSLEQLHIDAKNLWDSISEKKSKRVIRKINHELFDYVHGVISRIFKRVPHPRIKSNDWANYHRTRGNELFSENYDFLKTLHLYTTAVAYAEPRSESLSFAYSRRSMLFLTYGYYKQCLEDLKRALQCELMENVSRTLSRRLIGAEELLHNQERFIYHDAIPEIQKKNKFIDVASSAVAIRTNKTLGLHVVAVENIRVGDVLVVEAPYANTPEPEMSNMHCNDCLELCFNMIPCENCDALYCSEECKKQAYNLYHKYECILVQYGLCKKSVPLRTTLKALSEYRQFVNDLATPGKKYFRANRYKEIYQLDIRENFIGPQKRFNEAIEPVIFYRYLTTYTSILQDLHDIKNKEQVLKDLLVKNYFISRLHSLPVYKKKKNDRNNETVTAKIGTATYAFYSLFRHSCFSNTGGYFYGNKIVVRALFNIKKGEELTTSFGPLFSSTSKPTRQDYLLENYNFVCQCIPCVKNWPLIEHIRDGKPIPGRFIRRVSRLLRQEEIDINDVHELLMDAYTVCDKMPRTEIPTVNFLRLRTLISDLHLCLGNSSVVLDVED